jgi:hypothetical protein
MSLAARQQAHDLRDEDLSRCGGRAQTRRFDHRRAVEIVVLARCFPGGDSDADLQRRPFETAP